MSSAINFASESFKVCETVVQVSKSLDPIEMLNYWASHLDPSCLHMRLLLGLAGKGLTV